MWGIIVMIIKYKRLLIRNAIIISVIIVSIWGILYQNFYRNSNKTVIHIFVTAQFVDDELDNIIERELNQEYTNIEIEIFYINSTDELYLSTLQTKGIFDSDILIIPELIFEANDPSSFLEFNQEVIDNLILDDNYQLAYNQNKIYGISFRLDELSNTYSDNVIGDNEAYTLTINSDSDSNSLNLLLITEIINILIN